MTQPHCSRLRAGLLLGVAGLALAASHAARAGFDWVPPLTISNGPALPPPSVTTKATSAPADLPAVPPTPVAEAPAAPMPLTPASSSAMEPPPAAYSPPAIQWNAPPSHPAMSPPPAALEASAAPSPLASPPSPEPDFTSTAVVSATPAASDKPPVQGFGKNIPLPLALRQIVPVQYAFVFAPGVNAGTKISWHGGAPWDTTLNDALAVHGLQAVVADHTVRVAEAGAAPSATPPAPQPHVYSDAELAAIGEDTSNYHPSYPRHKPTAAPPSAASEQSAGLPPAMLKSQAAPAPSIQESASSSVAPSPPPVLPPPSHVAEAEAPLAAAPPPPLDTSGAFAAPGTISTRPATEDHASSTSTPSGAPVPLADLPLSPPRSAAPQEAAAAPADVTPPAAPEAESGFVPSPPPGEANAPVPSLNGRSFDMQAVDAWRAVKGDSLKDVLSLWCDRANVRLIWQTKRDYKLPANVSVNGTLPEALARVLGSYGTRQGRPAGELHPRLQDGSAALVIRTIS